MAMYEQRPKRLHDQRDPWDMHEYDDRDVQPTKAPSYSIAEIVFMDGTKHEFMVRASPSVVSHLVKEMKNTGYLTLWNDSDTLCVRADQVKHFSMREVTK
jgi:hypothetical protein